MKCNKCKKEFFNGEWKSGETYKGIDEHHNPPKFMMEIWKGKFYNLCRDCHRELHDEIIKILNDEANTLKFVNSEHWVWLKIIPKNRLKATKRVFKFTEEWVNGDTNEIKTERD